MRKQSLSIAALWCILDACKDGMKKKQKLGSFLIVLRRKTLGVFDRWHGFFRNPLVPFLSIRSYTSCSSLSISYDTLQQNRLMQFPSCLVEFVSAKLICTRPFSLFFHFWINVMLCCRSIDGRDKLVLGHGSLFPRFF
jgi:hypothetical protein